MNYFKHEGSVYAFDDEQVKQGWGSNMTRMSKKAIEKHLNPTKTIEQIKSEYSTKVQDHLDFTASKLGYDDIKAAVSYADEPSVPKFQDEGKAFRAWRSLMWEYFQDTFKLIEEGELDLMSFEDFLEDAPGITIIYS